MKTLIYPDTAWLIIAFLAAYRLAYLFAVDNGPAWIFKRWREYLAHRYGENSWQYEGAGCVFCQSVWFSFLTAGALYFIDLWPVRLVLIALALSGAIVALHWLVLVLIRRATM